MSINNPEHRSFISINFRHFGIPFTSQSVASCFYIIEYIAAVDSRQQRFLSHSIQFFRSDFNWKDKQIGEHQVISTTCRIPINFHKKCNAKKIESSKSLKPQPRHLTRKEIISYIFTKLMLSEVCIGSFCPFTYHHRFYFVQRFERRMIYILANVIYFLIECAQICACHPSIPFSAEQLMNAILVRNSVPPIAWAIFRVE